MDVIDTTKPSTTSNISNGTKHIENTESIEWIDEESEILYKKHKIKITEGENDIKAEVTIKGKEYGLIFKKGQVKEAIELAKQTIDYLSPEESKVIKYKGCTIYIIKLKDKFIAKGLYDAYGAGKMLLEEEGKTKKEVIKNIKKSIKDLETLSNKIQERDEKYIHTSTKYKKGQKNS